MKNETHYIPALTERNGRFQLSACNIWIREDEFSTEPTCAKCKAYVEEDCRELTAEDVFGQLDRSTLVKVEHFDPLSDYTERRR